MHRRESFTRTVEKLIRKAGTKSRKRTHRGIYPKNPYEHLPQIEEIEQELLTRATSVTAIAAEYRLNPRMLTRYRELVLLPKLKQAMASESVAFKVRARRHVMRLIEFHEKQLEIVAAALPARRGKYTEIGKFMRSGSESLKLLAELSGDFTPHADAAASGVREVIDYISMPTLEDLRAGRYGQPETPKIIEAENVTND